jgi:hypothetical protein
MNRILEPGLWLALMLVVGCGEDNPLGAGTNDGLPDGDLIATLVRVVVPDSPFYSIPFPPDPVTDRGESGQWDDAYRDDVVYGVAGTGFFRSATSEATVPLQVQVGAGAAGASVRALIDQRRGTLGVFGLLGHEVRVEVQVYRLR